MKKKSKKEKDPGTTKRGVELVRAVIAHESGNKKDASKRKPLAPDVVSKIRLRDGAPIPPTLAAWLAFDARGFRIDASGKLEPCDIAHELMLGYGGDAAAAKIPALAAIRASFEALPGDFYELGEYLYLWAGKPNEQDEYPIVAYENEGFVQAFPSFDLYLAHDSGYSPREEWEGDDDVLEGFQSHHENNPDFPSLEVG